MAAAMAIAVVGCGQADDRGAAAVQAGGGTGPAAATNGEAELRSQLEYLASDELRGRGAGTDGYDAAADFVEDQIASYGLEPLFPDAGGGASYRQPFGLANWEVRRTGSLLVTGGGTRELELLRDVQVAYVATDASWRRDLPVVYAGGGVVEPDLGIDELEGLDLDGACGVVQFELPGRLDPNWPAEVRERNPSGNLGLVRRITNLARRGAVCAIALGGPEAPVFWPQFMSDPNQLQSRTTAPEPAGPFVEFAVGLSAAGAEALFAGQPSNPDREADVAPFALRDTRVRVEMELTAGGLLGTANVGGLIPGTDPGLENEVIVLTAHLDGQGVRADGVVLNSANDNAASVVALLAAARELAATPARRPIAVVFTSAEEIGLLGSEQFVNAPPFEFSRIALNVNLEMVGKRRRGFGDYQFRVAGRHSDEIETMVTATRRRHGSVDFDYERRFETPDYQFRRADHVRFFLRGVPTIYFYGGGADYHQPSDDADGVEYDKVQVMAEVLFDLIRVTDEMDALPRSDGRS